MECRAMSVGCVFWDATRCAGGGMRCGTNTNMANFGDVFLMQPANGNGKLSYTKRAVKIDKYCGKNVRQSGTVRGRLDSRNIRNE